MTETLQILLKISLILFMVGNLLAVGPRLKPTEALVGLKNIKFVSQSMLWGFVLCPVLAIGIAMILPLNRAYATGLILLGMAPCAPFLPVMVWKAKGDLAYAAAFMWIASVFTVIYMPFAVPLLVEGLSVSAWTIAKPLLYFLLLPLAVGMTLHHYYEPVSVRIQPLVKNITGISTIIMLASCIFIYGKDFISAVGTYAIGAQIIFFAITTAASYTFSFGLPSTQKSVLSLGMTTRNLGAAFAPLFAIPEMDRRAIVMVALGVPMQTIFALLAARWFGKQKMKEEPKFSLKKKAISIET